MVNMLNIKRDWQLQEAKARLSAVVDSAQNEGPQRITRHGHPAAVVVSEADFQRLNAHDGTSLVDFLASLPLGDLDIERDRTDFGRPDVEF